MLSEVWSISTLTILKIGKDKKKVFPTLNVLCVGSQRRISNKGWHQEGPNREMNVSYARPMELPEC